MAIIETAFHIRNFYRCFCKAELSWLSTKFLFITKLSLTEIVCHLNRTIFFSVPTTINANKICYVKKCYSVIYKYAYATFLRLS